MPGRNGPQLSDEALDSLARQWFADVRAEQPKEPESKPRQDEASDFTLLDWLFGVDVGRGDSDGD